MNFKSIHPRRFTRNLLVSFTAFMMLSTLTMCKKDLGNYTYQELPQLAIDTTGAPGPFRAKQHIDELVITPKVSYTGDQTLEYYWIKSHPLGASLGMEDDTISREKELRMTVDFPVENGSIYNAYSLFFRVKEKETGRSEFIEYKLFVTGLFGKGLFVAHEKNGTADFDFIENPMDAESSVSRNVYSSVNNATLPGKITGIGPSGGSRAIFFATDQAARLLEYDGMKVVLSDDELFGNLAHPEPFKPERSYPSNYFINSGILYSSALSGFPTAIRYTVSDGSTYRASPNNFNTALVFDELNSRFLSGEQGGYLRPFPAADPSARFSLDNIQKKLLFLNTGFTLASSWAQFTSYAVFEDKQQPEKKSLYVFNHNDPLHPDYALVDISHAAGIQDALFYQTISSVPVIYYATPNKVYLLQINPAGNSVVEAGVQFTTPPGEEITALFGENDTYCYIATYAEATGKGKIYLMQRSTGNGVFNSEPIKTWTDFDGRITLMERKTS